MISLLAVKSPLGIHFYQRPWNLMGSCPRSSRASRLGTQCLPERDGRDKPGHDVEESHRL